MGSTAQTHLPYFTEGSSCLSPATPEASPLPVALKELLQTRTLGNWLPVTAAALLSMHEDRSAVFGGVTRGYVMLSAAAAMSCVELGGCSVPCSPSHPPPGLAAQPRSSVRCPLWCLCPCPGSRESMCQAGKVMLSSKNSILPRVRSVIESQNGLSWEGP